MSPPLALADPDGEVRFLASGNFEILQRSFER